MEAAGLKRLLDSLSKWSPLVLDEVFDDLNMAQTAHADSGPVELAQTAERLRKTLAYLVSIGRSTPPGQLTPEISRSVKTAASLSEPDPVARERNLVRCLVKRAERDTHAELGHLRRLARVTEELVQQMSAARLIKAEK
ncbi:MULTISPECIES: hypothetical protein [unclassified Streptomyces]|uniref:hypothetical protein n=1 Tax=unclassified Streptomyces TaxID=2593676 RepID=UPI002E2C415E|nr:hypothetical protein [Streptomyces sp. NBC_00223]